LASEKLKHADFLHNPPTVMAVVQDHGDMPIKLEGRLNLLHEADDDAVIWLKSTATAALAK